ncbi:peptidase associated/transthyretin-like domain-containing protein [Lacunimicrobium album]
MKNTPLNNLSTVALLALLLAGCGGGSADSLSLEKVTGVVTLSGAPLNGATVTFAPKTKGLRTAVGMTDQNGAYALTTITPADGAMAGDYAVIVVKVEAGKTSETLDSNDPNYGKGGTYPGASGTAKYITPEKFSSPATSGLTASVKEGKNEFNFDLKP